VGVSLAGRFGIEAWKWNEAKRGRFRIGPPHIKQAAAGIILIEEYDSLHIDFMIERSGEQGTCFD
jgi:hypothetical protein